MVRASYGVDFTVRTLPLRHCTVLYCPSRAEADTVAQDSDHPLRRTGPLTGDEPKGDIKQVWKIGHFETLEDSHYRHAPWKIRDLILISLQERISLTDLLLPLVSQKKKKTRVGVRTNTLADVHIEVQELSHLRLPLFPRRELEYYCPPLFFIFFFFSPNSRVRRSLSAHGLGGPPP